VLARTGYTRAFAEKIAAMAKDLTGRDDAWSLLAVDADLLADRLDFHGFQRRRLKLHISQMQEAKDTLLTPEAYVRVVLANEAATVAAMNRAEQVELRVQDWVHRGTQGTPRAPAPPRATAPPSAPTRAELVNSNEFLRATIELLEELVRKLEADKLIMWQEGVLDATLKLRRIQELEREKNRRIEDLERENERLSQHLQ
jgi:hypothetical protein